jgi:hypothetical protein
MTFEPKHQAQLTVPQREPFIGISLVYFLSKSSYEGVHGFLDKLHAKHGSS